MHIADLNYFVLVLMLMASQFTNTQLIPTTKLSCKSCHSPSLKGSTCVTSRCRRQPCWSQAVQGGEAHRLHNRVSLRKDAVCNVNTVRKQDCKHVHRTQMPKHSILMSLFLTNNNLVSKIFTISFSDSDSSFQTHVQTHSYTLSYK